MKYKFTLGIGISNARQEEIFTAEELGITEELTPKQTQKILEEELSYWAGNYIDTGFSEIED